MPTALDLPGPSRRIRVEPLRLPDPACPAQDPAPAREAEPAAPEPAAPPVEEPVPA